ncbi:ATP-grasp domain-containing protein [Gordonibacter massiliensis (ex Traore et al. 2017)]|uniref:ATP-grasp domain-containing protein n=1 Tax=Gordonibacter massiliensis (ex Traore et al. 2017) TaxID=1841863 RepID=UPI001C8BCB69|nr:ATP-grasp domain-containing protein [Gordonibacter massiliensis (ex Traore et al. 2017)]MBX9033638.1 ATP-grasp domain-containing protein [Gordonibacter massiliensis (ex Traore et al. 2017)]
MATVLVTSLGSVAADIIIKSLKRLGHKVVGCDIYPKEWVPDAFNVDIFYRAPLASEAAAYLDFVEEVCERENVAYVMPLTDVEVDVLNANRRRYESRGICFCMSPKETLETCRNKKLLKEFIDENCVGIKTIPTVLLVECETSPWEYPVIVKPYDGRSSIGLRRVHDDLEWAALANIPDPERYIVQPNIPGPIVMSELVRQPESGKVVVVVREELLETLNFCALAVRMYRDEELEERSRELANALGIVGSVNFEWILDDAGEYHFVECNPRFSAGAEFTCMAGYDLITNHFACFAGGEVEDFHYRREMVISRKYEEFLTKVEG